MKSWLTGWLNGLQSAEELAKVSENEANLASKRSALERERDNKWVKASKQANNVIHPWTCKRELEKIRLIDNQIRKQNKVRLNPRHSRFVGTYVAVNMKSINDENKLIVHRQAKNMDDLLDDSNKKITRKPKNKIVIEVRNYWVTQQTPELIFYVYLGRGTNTKIRSLHSNHFEEVLHRFFG